MPAKKKAKTLPDSKQLTLTGLYNKDRAGEAVAQADYQAKDQSNDAESDHDEVGHPFLSLPIYS